MAANELHAKLRSLWIAAGGPSCRALSRDVGGSPSHTVIAEALNGRRTPSPEKLRSLVEALDGDWSEFAPLYPAAPVRTLVIRDAWEPDIQSAILQELKAIRSLLERHSGSG